jgi:mono/diheme cytochrome c family protein
VSRSILLVSLAFMLTACRAVAQASPTPGQQADPRNGERIYFTSVSAREDRISYTGGPAFGGMMMGTYLTCAACHGPEAQGGLHQMHMTVMDAPDIRYAALNSMPEMQSGHAPYGLADFKLAVEEGQDPNGEALEADMPRWTMSDADLQDLFAFLKSLQ